MLLGVLALGNSALCGGAGAAPPNPQAQPGSTLRELATARGLLFGGAVNATWFDPNEAGYAEIVKNQFNAVVAENAMKWASLEGSQGSFLFNLADALLAQAQKNGQTMRGHTLIWHDSLPPWVLNISGKAEMQKAMKDHIFGVMKHFAGKVPIWDVVNEAITDTSEHGLRSGPFLDVVGPDYIEMAFRWAHEADPSAKLFYNDYGAEGINGKSDAIYNLVKGLLAKGVPINGVGFQSHLDTAFSVKDSRMQENLQRFRDLGLEVQLTEVDVQLLPDPNEKQSLEKQAQVYNDLMNVCLAVKCSAFMMWGVSDFDSWRSASSPLIFDEQYGKKPAYFALYKALGGK